MKQIILFFILLFSTTFLSAQTDSTVIKENYNDSLITITGKVIDTSKIVSFYNVMVVDKTLGKGVFGHYDGSFKIRIKKSDVIAISVEGYKTQYFSFKNKPFKAYYHITVYLKMLSYTAKVVEVKPLKTLAELKEERAAISKRELPKMTVGTAIQSPITALYMAFSKREKTKRMIAELEYKDQQKEVVKEILRLYVSANIIDLRDEQFAAFMTFLNLNALFLKTATDYELIVYIKYKFEHFENLNRVGY